VSVSVLLNTFDRARTLRWVLAAYRRQTDADFEVVVADDGSQDETSDVIEAARAESRFPIEHVRHERAGHRRAKILNEGIKACRHEIVLFTDADSLPRADLVEVHRRAFDPRRLSIGGCVRLDAAQTASLDLDAVRSGAYERFHDGAWRRRLLRRHWKNLFQIATRRRRRPHNLALNFCLGRSALLEVNGYDENFRGWGNADGDVRDRLKQVGVFPKSVWHRAIVFHLHHPPDPTRATRPNVAYSRRPAVPARCEVGILKPGESTPSPPPLLSNHTRPEWSELAT